MKEVKGSRGETELQTPEYAGPGPVRLRSTGIVEPPARDARHVEASEMRWLRDELLRATDRIGVLESQVKSLQMGADRGIGK